MTNILRTILDRGTCRRQINGSISFKHAAQTPERPHCATNSLEREMPARERDMSEFAWMYML
jgi:hypothetical protein